MYSSDTTHRAWLAPSLRYSATCAAWNTPSQVTPSRKRNKSIAKWTANKREKLNRLLEVWLLKSRVEGVKQIV
jgi:hypothetical protein